jgi:flagellar protein FliS
MRPHIHDNYLEAEVLSADPLKLVCLLYRGALSAIETARGRLAAGDIHGRSRAITKAHRIVSELSLSLDRNKGQDLSKQLVELYDYIQRLLLDANIKQSEKPMIEAARLLETLLEGWEGCAAAAAPPVRPTRARNHYSAEEYEPICLAG